MATSSYMFPFFFIVLVIALNPTLGAELLGNKCLPTSISNSTSAKQYNTNLNTLLKSLSTEITLESLGFSKGSMGRYDTQLAYGLINCRAGISSSDCKACAVESAKAARSLCPGSQGAVLWFDICSLKYSDTNFLGSVDTMNQFSESSPLFVTGDFTKFSSRVTEFLTKLSKEAVADPNLFAMGKTKADRDTTVYGLVECTRDLGGSDCGKCLKVVVGNFNLCCNGNKGGRFITASCMFRFEIYPF